MDDSPMGKGRPPGAKDRPFRPAIRTRNRALRDVAQRAREGDDTAANLLTAFEIVTQGQENARILSDAVNGLRGLSMGIQYEGRGLLS